MYAINHATFVSRLGLKPENSRKESRCASAGPCSIWALRVRIFWSVSWKREAKLGGVGPLFAYGGLLNLAGTGTIRRVH